jgi:GT2 family glycosyltransferase
MLDAFAPNNVRGNSEREASSNPWRFDLVLPRSLRLLPKSRWPTVLPEETIQSVLSAPYPHTWHRGNRRSRRGKPPRVSIIIPILNNLVCNRLCLESLLLNTEASDYEILTVDNGSQDGTLNYLKELSDSCPRVRLLSLGKNLGFASSVNRGLAEAQGECLVILNNDTVLPPGWLQPLLRWLEDPKVGLVGPVTNRTGNEAQIETSYSTYGELLDFAQDQRRRHHSEAFDIRMLAMFCAALRREVLAKVGPLDERFEVGLFEDDDYALRVRQAGYRVVCAEDSFVHHFGQMSLGQLPPGAYGILFHDNRRRWEAKWQTTWRPYQRRVNRAYEQLRQRIRECVERTLPTETTVLVVSKGDDELLRLNGRQAWHVPQDEEGGYAGYHPANCAEAISQLRCVRTRRHGRFLLLPQTEWWWLDHYPNFRRFLEANCPLVSGRDESCLIYSLANLGNETR